MTNPLNHSEHFVEKNTDFLTFIENKKSPCMSETQKNVDQMVSVGNTDLKTVKI